MIVHRADAQCAAGWNTATVQWDNLDYLTRLGTYSTFVTNQMRDTQYFTIGVNRLKIQLNGIATNGENTTNTAEAGSFGTGADVEYSGLGTITITFDTVVKNVQFSLYDIDASQKATVTSLDASAASLPVTMSVLSAGIVTVTGSGTNTAVATANATAALNTDVRATLNITIPGGAGGVKSVTITLGGTTGDFWLSDISACVFGSFPLNYYASEKPFTGQPPYYLVTPDNNSVYLFSPATGKADLLFSESASPWVNSLAYDHVNKIVYYIMDHSSPVATNKSLKKFDMNTSTISTVIPDLTTLGIPLFDIVVESAGAAFYNGSLFLGIEGSNTAHNANRESIVWRIDFDAAQNPIKAAQVYARPADNGSGTLLHDWGDFIIKDGTLYDFNTGNSGTTSQFLHFNMQTGGITIYNTNGNPVPIQAGQTWDGKLWWTGGQGAETGRVALYNEDGTIGAKINVVTTPCSPPWVNHAGDASDPIRPKSDFGDAPASYDPAGTDPATHEYDCNLRLGNSFDNEWVKASTPDASGDGSDEDGMPALPVFTHFQTTYDAFVKVYNNTGANATLASWVDFNNNGVFDPSEGVTATVATNAAIQTIHLTWTGQPAIPTSVPAVFMRLRVTSTSNGMTINQPTGYFSNGEVEDYLVVIATLLPIKLVSFEAKPMLNRFVDVSFTVSEETNMQSYVIERSSDGLVWQQWKTIAPSNNPDVEASYTERDQDPLPGISYYRLAMVSYSGNITYSTVKRVQFENQTFGIYSISPDPFSEKIQVTFTSKEDGQFRVRLIGADGRIIRTERVNGVRGNNSFNLEGLGNLTPGLYILEVSIGSEIAREKLIKR